MDKAEGPERTVDALTTRVLVLNFVSIFVRRINMSSRYIWRVTLTSVDIADRRLL